MVLPAVHLCSGYAGMELALRGIARTVAHVERDAYAAATLVARMEAQELDQAPVWSDLCTFDARAWRGRVALVTAGFPCQPFSSAGRKLGTDDDRWLWPEIARIIRDMLHVQGSRPQPEGRRQCHSRGDYSTLLVLQRDLLAAISELRGKNLACWCPLDQPCHADVLLDLANREVVY